MAKIIKCKDCIYWTFRYEGDFSIKYGICNCDFWKQAYGESDIETTSEDYCSRASQKEGLPAEAGGERRR